MKFIVRFYSFDEKKRMSKKVFNKDYRGFALLDRARIAFPGVNAENIAEPQAAIKNSWEIVMDEQTARKSSLFFEKENIDVLVSENWLNKWDDVMFEKDSRRDEVTPYMTIKNNELLSAWEAAGFPTDWTRPEPPESAPESAPEPKPDERIQEADPDGVWPEPAKT